MSPDRPAAVVVLAAGEGTRMKSAIPKVLHTVGGRTLVHHAVAAAERPRARAPRRRRRPRPRPGQGAPGRGRAQGHHRGPGRAARHRPRRRTAPCRGLPPARRHRRGDLRRRPAADHRDPRASCSAEHAGHGNAVTVLTAALADPTGYGRIVRDADGTVDGHRRAEGRHRRAARRSARSTPASTPSTPPRCGDGLGRLDTDNAQGEHYLTDVVGHRRAADGRRSAPWSSTTPGRSRASTTGSSSPPCTRVLNRRTVERWMRAGVTVVDPATTWIDVDVTLEPDTVLEPNTLLRGSTTRRDRRHGRARTASSTDTVVGAGAERHATRRPTAP